MKWQEVRQSHPDRWLLVEAAHARSEADQRILDDLVVLDTYEDSAIREEARKEIDHKTIEKRLKSLGYL